MVSLLTPVESLRLLVQDEIAVLPLRSYPLLSLAGKDPAYQYDIKWTVAVGGATTSGRAIDSAGALPASSDTNVTARLPIGDRVLGHAFNVLRTDIKQAAMTGSGAMSSLFTSHIRAGLEKIMTDLNRLLYTGTGLPASHGIVGLQKVTSSAPADDIYANLSRATYPLWDSYKDSNGAIGRDISREMLSSLHAASVRRGGNYDVIFTTPEIVEAYKTLFATDTATQVSVSPMGYADIGFASIGFNGRPIIADPGCPDGEVYFLNSRGVRVHTFDLSNTTPDSAAVNPQTSMGINMLVAQIPTTNPHVISYELSTLPQLQVFNRRKDVALLSDVNQ